MLITKAYKEPNVRERVPCLAISSALCRAYQNLAYPPVNDNPMLSGLGKCGRIIEERAGLLKCIGLKVVYGTDER
jgi:hypothetical protein